MDEPQPHLPQPLLHPSLLPFYTQDSLIKFKTFSHPLFPYAYLVRNPKDKVLMCF